VRDHGRVVSLKLEIDVREDQVPPKYIDAPLF